MTRKLSSDKRHRQYVKSVRVAASLLDEPGTLAEIVHRSFSYLIPLGLFKTTERQARNQTASVKQMLEELIQHNWIVYEEGRYALTPLGREEVNKRFSQLRETGALVRKLLRPQTVSKVTLGVHLALAALKMPAALLSGSVGLLNDALDTLLDGFSSLLVYIGIRFEKERSVNILLVFLMLLTGLLTLYEAGRRFFVSVEPEVDWFVFLAAVLSAIICLGLWAYQRYVGLQSGILALITQSVDSRNHVVVAISVTAGLVASLLRFPLLDTLVGLGVALLILKSAIELAMETIRSLNEELVDLSRYQFGISALFHRFLQSQLRGWMLYLVEKRGIKTRAELVARARQALDFNQIPAVRVMELVQGEPQVTEIIERSLAELFEHNWLTEEGHLHATEAGKKQLSKYL